MKIYQEITCNDVIEFGSKAKSLSHPAFGCMEVSHYHSSVDEFAFGFGHLTQSGFHFKIMQSKLVLRESSKGELNHDTQKQILNIQLNDIAFLSLMKNTTTGELIPINIDVMPVAQEVLDVPSITKPFDLANEVKNCILSSVANQKMKIDALMLELDQFLAGEIKLTPKQVNEHVQTIVTYTKHIRSNIKFHVEQWVEYFENQESYSRTEINAVIQQHIFNAGIEAVKKDHALLIGTGE